MITNARALARQKRERKKDMAGRKQKKAKKQITMIGAFDMATNRIQAAEAALRKMKEKAEAAARAGSRPIGIFPGGRLLPGAPRRQQQCRGRKRAAGGLSRQKDSSAPLHVRVPSANANAKESGGWFPGWPTSSVAWRL